MKPPAFQCYADDLLAGTSDMTAEEFGVYWRLICHSWNKGGLPNDDARLALMAGQCSGTAVAYAKTKFVVGEDGLLRNLRLEKVRQEQEDYRKMQSDKAHLRWDRVKQNGNAAAYAPAQAGQCSPTPTPSPQGSLSPIGDKDENTRKRFVKPTIQELELHCAKIGLPKDHGSQFWHFYESKGWKVGNQPMKSWPSAMQTWKRKWDERGQPQLSRGVDRRENNEVVELKKL